MFEKFFAAKNIVVDTGPLLIHAVGAFDRKKLKDVCLCDQPEEEFEFIDRLFTSRKQFYITPYILSELFYQVRSKCRLNENKIMEFIKIYGDFLNKIDEFHTNKEKIINNKNIKFGLADISLIIANKEKGFLIISGDTNLCGLCNKENIDFIDYRILFFNRIFYSPWK